MGWLVQAKWNNLSRFESFDRKWKLSLLIRVIFTHCLFQMGDSERCLGMRGTLLFLCHLFQRSPLFARWRENLWLSGLSRRWRLWLVIQSRAQDTNLGVKQLRITWKVLETLEANQFLPLMAIRRRTGSESIDDQHWVAKRSCIASDSRADGCHSPF